MAGATSFQAFYMSGRVHKGNAGGLLRLEPEWSDPSANPEAGRSVRKVRRVGGTAVSVVEGHSRRPRRRQKVGYTREALLLCRAAVGARERGSKTEACDWSR